jgi:hypothetical protein
MKFMDRLKARHALKAQGATPAEAADQVRKMKEAPITAPVVAAPKPAPVVAAPKPAPVVAPPALVTPPVVAPKLVTEGDVVIAGEKETPVADMTSAELDDMTVVELREFASEFDIEGRSSMDKAELVAALEAL